MTAATATATVTNITAARNPFLYDVIKGLSARRKRISPKYFYDDIGSQYFDEICQLKEYYPFRTELNLLETVASDIAAQATAPLTVVEFGAGSLKKIEPLLRQVRAIRTFVPVDISGAHLSQSAARLALKFPHLDIKPVKADFTETVQLRGSQPYLGFFPGSTIGNFNPAQALQFLQNARETLRPDGELLIGVDTKKSVDVLHRAYNDGDGVTARFNLNLLTRINKELGGNIDTGQFEHYAFYDPEQGCIQMHLISLCDQVCNIAGHDVFFTRGESIHTENSYKYAPWEFKDLAERAGWHVKQSWLADDNYFSVFLLGNQIAAS